MAAKRDVTADRDEAEMGEALLFEAAAPWADLEAQQRAFEAEMDVAGRARFFQRVGRAEARGAGSETPFGQRAVAAHVERVAEALRADLDAARRRRGPRPVHVRLLGGLDPHAAAYVALEAIVDVLESRPRLATLAARVGEALEDLTRLAALDAADARRAARLRRLGDAGRRAAARAQLRAEPAAGLRWELRERELAGVKMLDLARAATGLFEIEERTESGGGAPKTIRRVIASAEAVAARSALHALSSGLKPAFQPMVSPPAPWLSSFKGGYISNTLGRVTLIKTHDQEQLEALSAASAPDVFRAVNAAQATAWRVNADVLAVLDALQDAPDAAAAAGLPARAPAPKPPKDAPAAERRRAWDAEATRRSRVLALDRLRAAAHRVRRFERIYFPAQLDFRGRLYFSPSFNPQGPDAMKALLGFAEAKPLGEEGWWWLAIHLANCGDFGRISKAPLLDRVEWTLAHEERVFAAAADPLAELWWTEADQPFQFLAACFEWAGFRAEGPSFRSRLPIALDGSCSGIQHFSLAFRDEIGGRAVNLAPSAQSADIYAEVAEAVRAMLERDVDSAETIACGRDESGAARRAPVAALARQWLDFGVTRALCKRPTMTYGYGARSFGFAQQILDDTLAPAFEAFLAGREGAIWPFDDAGFAAALYMARRLTTAVEVVVVKAAEAMRWLQTAASLAAAEERPLRWTTPDGFFVKQAYQAARTLRVRGALSDRRIRLNLRDPSGKLDARRQRQGAAPNFVHSLDACHLRMAVNRAAAEGVTSFALVHDSFGAPAADTPRFFEILRETMVEMYGAVDVVSAFEDEIGRQLSAAARAKLPRAPERGALALEGVLQNPFCFS